MLKKNLENYYAAFRDVLFLTITLNVLSLDIILPGRESEVNQSHFSRNFWSVMRVRQFSGDVKSTSNNQIQGADNLKNTNTDIPPLLEVIVVRNDRVS